MSMSKQEFIEFFKTLNDKDANEVESYLKALETSSDRREKASHNENTVHRLSSLGLNHD